MALLCLGQHLIDFMNKKAFGFMEVGGPFDNIVIQNANGGIGKGSGNSSGSRAMVMATVMAIIIVAVMVVVQVVAI